MITLETERLLLREFRDTDLDAYARMCADAESMRYLGDGTPLSRVEAWRSIAGVLGHWQLRGYGMWAAEEKATGDFVGRIGFYYPDGWPVLEVGWLVDRARWGEGFATEGGRAALAWGFEQLGLDTIYAVIRPANAPSIRVAEKLGETLRRQEDMRGAPVSIYGVDREMFRAGGR